METNGGGPVSQLDKKYYIDSTYITVPREGVEINTPLRDGLGRYLYTYIHTADPPSPLIIHVLYSVEDWDLYQRLIDHLYTKHLRTTPTEHPVLMSEKAVSTLCYTEWV